MTDPAPDDDIVLGLFRIGPDVIAVDIGFLREATRIDVLHRCLDTTDRVLGMITIRGALIPVIDLAGSTKTPTRAAVLATGDQAVAIAVDDICGLRRFPAAAVQRLSGPSLRGLSAGSIHEDGSVIHLLDAAGLLADDSVPKARVTGPAPEDVTRAPQVPFLTFLSGGVSFGIKADSIVGTVPRQRIEDDSVVSPPFLGRITYYRRKIPVVAANRLFGIGDMALPDDFETIVLRLPDDRLVGLATDRILRVANGLDEQAMALPSHAGAFVRLIRAAANLDDTAHFLVAEDLLLTDPGLIAIAGLCDPASARTDQAAPPPGAAQGAVRFEQDRFLMIDAGARLAIRLSDIDAMRSPPQPRDMFATGADGAGALGLMVLDGRLVPLVRLTSCLGHPSPEATGQERVLLSGHAGQPVAYLVDTLAGIAGSDWITTDAGPSARKMPMVGLRAYGLAEVRHVVDLRKLSSELLDGFAAACDRAG